MTTRRSALDRLGTTLGRTVAPPRFVLFAAILALATPVLHATCGTGWALALVLGFDAAALAFIASLPPILRDRSAATMRSHAAANDANRTAVLLVTISTALAMLMAIASELPDAREGHPLAILLLVLTLALSWTFSNVVFALHYAHMHYARAADSGRDTGGFDFPGTTEPDYWDFLYFSFTAGMSFAASDVDVTNGAVRRVVLLHTLLSFVFNIGVLAFSINVLAGTFGSSN